MSESRSFERCSERHSFLQERGIAPGERRSQEIVSANAKSTLFVCSYEVLKNVKIKITLVLLHKARSFPIFLVGSEKPAVSKNSKSIPTIK